MRIGMHVRAFERGVPVAVRRALERGAETIQVFASSPRAWRFSTVDPAADRQLIRQMREFDVRPLFIHAPYLVNLASADDRVRRRSLAAIVWSLERAEAMGAAAVVAHAGSNALSRARGIRLQARAILRALGEGGRGPKYLLELTAGGIGAVASRFPEAAEVFDACHGNPRLGICIDTCHLHAAGYDLSGPEGVSATLNELRASLGARRLGLVHANDSRDPRGSRRDRHWHVGRGAIGMAGFRALVADPLMARVPFICETPGDLADDRRNIRTLKRLRALEARLTDPGKRKIL